MRGHKRLRGTTWELIAYDRRAKKNVSESLPGRGGRPRSEREANTALARLITRLEAGHQTITRVRFDAVVEEWLQLRRASGRLSQATFEQYEWIARTKLVPAFGKHQTDTIGRDAVQNLYNRLLTTYSARTVRHVHAVLRQVLKHAQRSGYLTANPMEGLELPQLPPPIDAPDPEDVHQFIDTAGQLGPDWKVLVRLMAVSGLRRGEIAALRWRAIDLEHCQIAVRQAINGSSVKRPKTESSVRTLHIDATTTDMLQTHFSWCEDRAKSYGLPAPSKDHYVFSRDPEGAQPLHPSTITHRFQDIRELSSADVRPHDMRRFSATQQSAAGVSLRELMGRHGWKDVRTAMRYAGYLPARDAEIADLMGSTLYRHANVERS